jgi:hypothetical protein
MKYLSFDRRALACLRIGIAALLMLDLLIRVSDLEAFYSDTGVVPLEMLFKYGWNSYYVSVHTISGLWQVQLLLFLFSFVCAFMLLIGYRTQLFTVLCWFMLLSLHNRNGFILQGGDDLLRMVLFWSIFIPWGSRYSYDSLHVHTEPYSPVVPVGAATLAYLIQVCYLYTGSALLKGVEWDTDFTALYYTYSLDQIAYPLTKQVYYYPDLLKVLTKAAYYFELFVPALFFMPIAHSFFRALGVALIIIFHSMNEMTLFIGLFPMIGIVTSLGILPSFIFDKLEGWLAVYKPRLANGVMKIGKEVKKIIRWKAPVVLNYRWQQVQTATLVFLMVFVFDWNFSNLSFVKSKLSDNLRFIGYGLRLNQNWGMFAPNVFKDDGWYILKGTPDKTEESFDLLNPHRKLTMEKPAMVVKMFKNDRWRKYYENLLFSDHAFMRGYFCHYMKRTWNKKNPTQKICSLEVIYMKEFTLPHYQHSVPEKITLWICEE